VAVTAARAPRRGAQKLKPKRRKNVFRRMREEWSAYLMQSPGLLLFAVFVVFSISFSVYISFHRWDILNPAKPYVGLENYRTLVHDDTFKKSLYNTFIYTLFSVPLTMVGGLLIALLLNQSIRGRGLFRTIFFIPVITPIVIAALIWKWVYDYDYGLANYYLEKLHIIGHPQLWLANPDLALPSVIAMTVWKGMGFAMVIYLAGLQSIPEEYYEAAKVDGAGPLHRLRYITIPLLAPTSFFLLVIGIIGAFQVFTEIYIMTGGGPLSATSTIVWYLWTMGFKNFQMGYATAIAYALFAIIFVFTCIQVRFLYREAEY
jgi:multiple sugar transport system permease protein